MIFRTIYYLIMCILISAGISYFGNSIFPNIRILVEGNIHNSILFSISSVILAMFECVVVVFGIAGCIFSFEMAKNEFDKWGNEK